MSIQFTDSVCWLDKRFDRHRNNSVNISNDADYARNQKIKGEFNGINNNNKDGINNNNKDLYRYTFGKYKRHNHNKVHLDTKGTDLIHSARNFGDKVSKQENP